MRRRAAPARNRPCARRSPSAAAAHRAPQAAGPGRYGNLTVSKFTVRRNGSTAICDGEVRFEHAVPGKKGIVVHAHFLAVWREESGVWRLAGYASPAITL